MIQLLQTGVKCHGANICTVKTERRNLSLNKLMATCSFRNFKVFALTRKESSILILNIGFEIKWFNSGIIIVQ